MEVVELRSFAWDANAYECARRCLAAAYTAKDAETRSSLARAARRYLRKAHGLEEKAPAGLEITAGAGAGIGL